MRGCGGRAPADGTYYIVVKGYGDSVGMFSAILTEQADACAEGGLTLTASSATISFNPVGEEGEFPQLMCAPARITSHALLPAFSRLRLRGLLLLWRQSDRLTGCLRVGATG